MKFSRFLPFLAVAALPFTAAAQTFQEGFENFPALFTGSNPWALANTSDSAAGGTSWFAGDPTFFAAQSGTGYAAANFLSTGGVTGTETISNWLISPALVLTPGGQLSFWTRNPGAGIADRLEVRLSLSGTSTNVGTTSATTGDFSTVLLTINSTQTATGYPGNWTQFNVTLPAVAGIGRIGFRYFVTNSGINGPNGDYIGVDTLTSNLVLAPVPEPSTYALCVVGLAAGGWMVSRRRRLVPVAVK